MWIFFSSHIHLSIQNLYNKIFHNNVTRNTSYKIVIIIDNNLYVLSYTYLIVIYVTHNETTIENNQNMMKTVVLSLCIVRLLHRNNVDFRRRNNVDTQCRSNFQIQRVIDVVSRSVLTCHLQKETLIA